MQELRVISIAKNKLHTEQTVISHMPKKFVVFQSDAKKRNKTTYYMLSISVKICIPAHFLRLREISLLADIYIYIYKSLYHQKNRFASRNKYDI